MREGHNRMMQYAASGGVLQCFSVVRAFGSKRSGS